VGQSLGLDRRNRSPADCRDRHGGIAIYRAEPNLRADVIETLSTRFKSKVELDASMSRCSRTSSVRRRPQNFRGTDPNNHQPGFQPIINVAEFSFHMGLQDLFRFPVHVDTVFVKGLQLNLPPRENRGEMNRMAPKGGK